MIERRVYLAKIAYAPPQTPPYAPPGMTKYMA